MTAQLQVRLQCSRLIVLALFATLTPVAAAAQSRPGFAGRLPCVDAASTLRQGTFTLPVGRVRLKEARACVKPDTAYKGCEWTVTLVRSDHWGEGGRFLVVTVEAIHDSPGAWLSVLVYRCRGDHYEPVFAKNFGPRGAELILGADLTFEVVSGEWRPTDPGCCPSQRRRSRHMWNDRQQRFVLVESTVVDVKKTAS